MGLVNTLVRWALRGRLRRLQQFMQAPEAAQEQWFLQLIQGAAQTQWGKKYDYKSITSPTDFAQRVPISEYDDLKPFIRLMMLGETDVLWRGKVRWFSKSSGTTSDKSKYLPVSNENLRTCHLKGGHDAMAFWYAQNPDTRLLSARGLIMGGSFQPFPENPNIRVGDVSAIMISNMPFYAKYFHSPDIQTALMGDWEAKIEKIAQAVRHQDITSISGVPTWTMVLLRRILDLTGKKNLLEVFPNFELYLHGGVSFAPYRQQFRQFFPSDKVQYREIYNASEGFFAAQCQADDDSMLLLLDNGVFYEFVPLAELNNPHPKTLTIAEVELNKNYAMLISTNAGLWRYLIGDTVKFTSLRPHKIQITGRTKHFINTFGEEVMVENTDRALALVCAETGASVREYTVAPIYLNEMGKGGHEWLVEFDIAPPDLHFFAERLDQQLQQLNSDYEAKRYKNIALQPLVLHSLPQGTFHAWLKSRGKYGGQNKVPRLSNSREYLEGVFAMNK